MISWRRQPTLLTLMPALAQVFRHRCATETCLTRATRVDLHQHTPSPCRFVRELVDENRPSSIGDRLGQHATGQAFDVQVFDGSRKPQGACCFAVVG